MWPYSFKVTIATKGEAIWGQGRRLVKPEAEASKPEAEASETAFVEGWCFGGSEVSGGSDASCEKTNECYMMAAVFGIDIWVAQMKLR